MIKNTSWRGWVCLVDKVERGVNLLRCVELRWWLCWLCVVSKSLETLAGFELVVGRNLGGVPRIGDRITGCDHV